ncbi:MAG: hypothetical protein ACR2OF_03055 [Hyphomicrobium sp.]
MRTILSIEALARTLNLQGEDVDADVLAIMGAYGHPNPTRAHRSFGRNASFKSACRAEGRSCALKRG